MGAPSTEDLVVVHLDGAEDVAKRTTSGIGEGLRVGSVVSARIELLSAISSLEVDGLIEARTAPPSVVDDRIYDLTEAGASRAAELRDQFGDREIVIEREGDRETVSLAEARVELGVTSIAAVLARARDGVVRLGDVPEDTFVGRSEALETLGAHLDALADGDGGIVAITGQRGIGKTELLDRFARRVDEGGFERVSITCSTDVTEPFQPIRDALAEHDVDDPFERTDADLDGADSLSDRRTDLFFDVRNALADLADGRPLVVTVDDLHEASPAVLDLIEFLADSRPEDVSLVVAARPDELAAAVGEADTTLDTVAGADAVGIELDPLDRETCRELVVRTLHDRSVPESVTDRLHRRTGGIPLFLVETLSRLRETGTIDPHAGVYPESGADVPTPENVSAAIETRLDALDETPTEILECGAVVGHEIDVDVLAAACDHPPDSVREYADLLVSARLWERRDGVRFVSDVIRDVVLDRIDEDRLVTLHERVAEAHDRREGDDRSPAAIARHYERAGDPDRALDAYLAAGDQAIEVYAHEEALENYQRSMEIARELDRQEALVETLEAIGRVNYLSGEYDEATRYLEYLRDRTDDPGVIQRSYLYRAEMEIERGNLDGSAEFARTGLDVVDEPNRDSCRLQGHVGWAHLLQGDLDAAAGWFENQYELATHLDDDRLGGAYHNLGTIEYYRGEPDAAIELLERAVDANERSGAIRDAAASYNNLSMAYQRAGDVEKAREATETALEYAREVGDRSQEVSFMGNLAGRYYDEGDQERARELWDRSLEAARTLGLQSAEGNLLLASGIYYLERCDFDRARDRLESALDLVTAVGNARMITAIRCDLARLNLYENRPNRAREHAEAAMDTSEGTTPELTAEARIRMADVEIVDGNPDAAREAGQESLDLATDCGNVLYQGLARLHLALVHEAAGDLDAAVAAAETAREDVETIDVPRIVVQTQLALARVRRLTGEHEAAEREFDAATDVVDDLELDLFGCWLRLERALLASDREEPDALDRLEDARGYAADNGAELIAELAADEIDERR